MPRKSIKQNQARADIPPSDGTCYFDKLPDEVRLRIYRLVLGGNTFSLTMTGFKTRASLPEPDTRIVTGKAKVEVATPTKKAVKRDMFGFLKPLKTQYKDDTSEKPVIRRNRVKILRVSKKIYSEALPILYGENHLKFPWMCTFADFTRKPLEWSPTPVENEAKAVKYSTKEVRPGLQYVRNIELKSSGRYDFDYAMINLAVAQNIKSLVVLVDRTDARYWEVKKSSFLFKSLNSYFGALDSKERQGQMLAKTKFVPDDEWEDEFDRKFSSDDADKSIRRDLAKFLKLK